MRSDTSHHTYRQKLNQLKQKHLPCHICGGPINYTLKAPHPQSFTADHITPVSLGGHKLGQLKPAHLTCNSRRGNKPLNQIQERHTRKWY